MADDGRVNVTRSRYAAGSLLGDEMIVGSRTEGGIEAEVKSGKGRTSQRRAKEIIIQPVSSRKLVRAGTRPRRSTL